MDNGVAVVTMQNALDKQNAIHFMDYDKMVCNIMMTDGYVIITKKKKTL